jgi:hypothetical protein
VGQLERLKDTNAMRIFYVAFFAALLAAPLQGQQSRSCQGNAGLVDQCFKVHGRVRIVNGAGLVIWRIGTDRILRVEDEEIVIPDSLK